MSATLVHIRHCCLHHGCKYGHDDCPVASGMQKQEFACEYCRDEALPKSATLEERVAAVLPCECDKLPHHGHFSKCKATARPAVFALVREMQQALQDSYEAGQHLDDVQDAEIAKQSALVAELVEALSTLCDAYFSDREPYTNDWQRAANTLAKVKR